MYYELVLLFRPDLMMGDISAVLETLVNIIEKAKGTLHAEEYWGFRTLAYRVEKRSKAHYFFMVFQGQPALLTALRDYLKFSKGLLRFFLVKTQEKTATPTALYVSTRAQAIAGVGQHPTTAAPKMEAMAPAAPVSDIPA